MTFLSFQNFGGRPRERAAIEGVFKGLDRSEIGRRFRSSLPPRVTFQYFGGDRSSRAKAMKALNLIIVYQNTFDSPFDTIETILHELAHLLQSVLYLEPGLKPKLEGAYRVLARHQNEPRFAWVAEPLKRLKTEETLAQEMVRLILMLGHGRPYRNHYYIPGDEPAPPKGTLHPTLSPEGRLEFENLKDSLQARALSPTDLHANLDAYEEFYRRAREVGWIGPGGTIQADLDNERRMRGKRTLPR